MKATRHLLRVIAAISVMAAAWFFAADLPEGVLTLETKTLHLGKSGQYEWESYKDVPVDAEALVLHFDAKANDKEHTLIIRQKDVKLTWPVLLNGKKLGALTTAEPAQDCVFAIAPGMLKDGENVLEIKPPANLDDIEVGPARLISKSLPEAIGGSKVQVTVTEAVTGKALPCRLTLTRTDGTLQALRAEPAAEVSVRTGVVYTRKGNAELSVPPGEYVLYAGRGFEWSVAQTKLTVQPGENPAVKLQLTREVPTEGWVAADSHIHTLTFSGHGDAKIEERMLTIAGEGIELAIATDHNHHADYTTAASSMGVSDRFTSVVGNEVTTKHGHFNAFPIAPGAPVVDHTKDDWSVLIPVMRATPGVKVITLNHPRDLHSGFVPLGGLQFSPGTGKHRQAEALRGVDAMEVITSGAMQSDIHLLYRDWFALLNRGHRFSAIASSDSHDVTRFILGQGRTYVAVPDADPAKIDLDKVWQSYQQGRLLVSLGLLAQVRVDEKYTMGDLATRLGATVKVTASVYGPSWVKADHVALYANGILVREQKITDDGKPGEKAVVTWEIPKPKHDAYLVVIATGPGVTAPYWDIPRPYQPTSKTFTSRVIGSTNPVWLDADGSGKFESAYDYAASLVQQHGADAAKLKAALRDYDETVAAQVGSMAGQ
ncbi:MAG TPA: CehA/McbA family metallohydrolase [Candidatus Saccharimonadia bacterium]|nr:CehA/McbA family metallohydrolase [Candidatus Saccharimonadia bacterium]